MIKTVDIGNPILSMHSIRELGGVADQAYITQVFNQYYKEWVNFSHPEETS